MAAKKKLVAKKRPAARAVEADSVRRAPSTGKSPMGKSPMGKATAGKPPSGKSPTGKSTAARMKADGKPKGSAAPAKKTAARAASSSASKAVPTSAPRKPQSPAKAAAPAVKAPVPSKTLGPGDRAPSFELPDQSGAPVSSADLAGKPYLLYFYPKDDTPGCTTQACGFRDASADFEEAGVRVIGVSPDSVSSHQKFVAKYGLPFTLLSDARQELAAAYGVWSLKKNYGREYMGIVRSTFLIDGEGVVRKAWRSVRVNGHVAEVGAAAAELA